MRSYHVAIPELAGARSCFADDAAQAAQLEAERAAWRHDLGESDGPLLVSVYDEATGVRTRFNVSIQLHPRAIAVRVPS